MSHIVVRIVSEKHRKRTDNVHAGGMFISGLNCQCMAVSMRLVLEAVYSKSPEMWTRSGLHYQSRQALMSSDDECDIPTMPADPSVPYTPLGDGHSCFEIMCINRTSLERKLIVVIGIMAAVIIGLIIGLAALSEEYHTTTVAPVTAPTPVTKPPTTPIPTSTSPSPKTTSSPKTTTSPKTTVSPKTTSEKPNSTTEVHSTSEKSTTVTKPTQSHLNPDVTDSPILGNSSVFTGILPVTKAKIPSLSSTKTNDTASVPISPTSNTSNVATTTSIPSKEDSNPNVTVPVPISIPSLTNSTLMDKIRATVTKIPRILVPSITSTESVNIVGITQGDSQSRLSPTSGVVTPQMKTLRPLAAISSSATDRAIYLVVALASCIACSV